MWGHHYLGVFNQRAFTRRLLREDVQCGAGQLPRLKGFQQGILIDELAPGHVDDTGARFHHGQLFFANQATVFSMSGV